MLGYTGKGGHTFLNSCSCIPAVLGTRELEISTETRERGTQKFRNAIYRVPGAGARATVGAGADAGSGAGAGVELELEQELELELCAVQQKEGV